MSPLSEPEINVPLNTAALARIHAAWHDSPWADAYGREAAAAIEAAAPGTREIARRIRRRERQVTRWAMGQGCAGVVFAACGFPASPEPHTACGGRVILGRFVFADPDPAIQLVNTAHRAQEERVSAVRVSAREPERLLGRPEVAAIGGPLAVQLQHCVHWWPPDLAADVIARYGALLSRGSMLTLTAAVPAPGADPQAWAQSVSGPHGTAQPHTPAVLRGWLEAAGMTPERGVTHRPRGSAGMMAAVTAVKR